ncbi:unnamed protein product [Calypogeia fissa]
MGLSGAKFKAEVDGSSKKLKLIISEVLDLVWTITYVKDSVEVCKALALERCQKPGGLEESSASTTNDMRRPTNLLAQRVSMVVELGAGSTYPKPSTNCTKTDSESQRIMIRSLRSRLIELTEDIAESLGSVSLNNKK